MGEMHRGSPICLLGERMTGRRGFPLAWVTRHHTAHTAWTYPRLGCSCPPNCWGSALDEDGRRHKTRCCNDRGRCQPPTPLTLKDQRELDHLNSLQVQDLELWHLWPNARSYSKMLHKRLLSDTAIFPFKPLNLNMFLLPFRPNHQWQHLFSSPSLSSYPVLSLALMVE